MPGLDDPGRSPAGDLTDGFGLDGGQPRGLPVTVDGDQPPLGLRHDLRGDDEDIAVTQRDAVGGERGHDDSGQVVAGMYLADPPDSGDGK